MDARSPDLFSVRFSRHIFNRCSLHSRAAFRTNWSFTKSGRERVFRKVLAVILGHHKRGDDETSGQVEHKAGNRDARQRISQTTIAHEHQQDGTLHSQDKFPPGARCRRNFARRGTSPGPHSKRMTLEQVSAIALTFTWRELEDRFRDLQAKTKGDRFSATFIRTEWDSGAITEDWIVGGSPGSRKVLEHLASIAVRKLGLCTHRRGGPHTENELGLREWVGEEGMDKDKDFAWCPPGSVCEQGVKTGTTKSLQTERRS